MIAGIAMMAMTVASAVISSMGQAKQAAAAQAQANYMAQVAKNNQIIAGQNAQMAREAAQAQVQRQFEKTAGTIGAIRAAQASNGVDVNSGSALDVQSSAAELGQLDAASIRYEGERQARAYENQGRGFADQATLYRMQADASAPSSLSLIGNILGAAGSVGSKWMGWQNSGLLSSGGSSWDGSLNSFGRIS